MCAAKEANEVVCSCKKPYSEDLMNKIDKEITIKLNRKPAANIIHLACGHDLTDEEILEIMNKEISAKDAAKRAQCRICGADINNGALDKVNRKVAKELSELLSLNTIKTSYYIQQ